MSQIELIAGLPDWKWKPHSAGEIARTSPQELIDNSDFIWRVGEVAVAGFIHTSWTSPPWMWFLLAENIGFKDLIDFRMLAMKILPGTLTAVDEEFPVAMKFAKFYGFVETEETAICNDHSYRIMRKV